MTTALGKELIERGYGPEPNSDPTFLEVLTDIQNSKRQFRVDVLTEEVYRTMPARWFFGRKRANSAVQKYFTNYSNSFNVEPIDAAHTHLAKAMKVYGVQEIVAAARNERGSFSKALRKVISGLGMSVIREERGNG